MVEELSAARFPVEARVACNCGTWEPGAVIGHGYTDERLDGQVYPYQVRLDDGRLFCVPADEDRSIRVHEVTENGDDEEDDDDDSSDDDDDDENEAGREHLFVGEVPDSKYLCILIPAKGTKRKQEDEQKDEQEDKPEDKQEDGEEPARREGEKE